MMNQVAQRSTIRERHCEILNLQRKMRGKLAWFSSWFLGVISSERSSKGSSTVLSIEHAGPSAMSSRITRNKH